MSNKATKTCLNCGCALLTPNYPEDGACAAYPIDNASKEGPCCGFADIDMSNFGTVDCCDKWVPRKDGPATQVADSVEPADILEDIARDMYALIGSNLDIPHDVMRKLRHRFDERARAIGEDLSTEPYAKRTAEGVTDEN